LLIHCYSFATLCCTETVTIQKYTPQSYFLFFLELKARKEEDEEEKRKWRNKYKRKVMEHLFHLDDDFLVFSLTKKNICI